MYLQWSRRLSTVAIGGNRCLCQMTYSLQWSRRLSTVAIWPSPPGSMDGCTPFNGAAAFRRWQYDGPSGTDDAGHPSMEPPPFDGGNSAPGAARPAARRTFNGAAAFRRWQFGGFGAWRVVPAPSMEPPPFDGGNTSWAPGSVDSRSLQWSRRLSTVAIPGGLPGPGLALRPSMEPPPFDGGNMVSIEPIRTTPQPSMEPPPFDGGNSYPCLDLSCRPGQGWVFRC